MRQLKLIILLFAVFSDTAGFAASKSCQSLFTLNEHFDRERLFYQSAMHSRNAEARQRLADQSRPLRFLTFNTGLLSKFCGKICVPDYLARSQEFLTYLHFFLDGERPFAVTLQEVWSMSDAGRISAIAEKSGYRSFVAKEQGEKNLTGLQTLIRKDLLMHEYSTIQYPVHELPRTFTERAVGVHKGVFPVHATLNSGERILIINAHFSFAKNNHDLRAAQVQELTTLLGTMRDSFDYLAIGVDTNASDHFPPDFDAVASGWFRDKEVYLNLLGANNRFALLDSFRAVHESGDGFTQDPVSNALTRQSLTTRNEPRQRLDFIFFGASPAFAGDFYVESSELAFHQPVPDLQNDSRPLFLSDHFGIQAELHILIGP